MFSLLHAINVKLFNASLLLNRRAKSERNGKSIKWNFFFLYGNFIHAKNNNKIYNIQIFHFYNLNSAIADRNLN